MQSCIPSILKTFKIMSEGDYGKALFSYIWCHMLLYSDLSCAYFMLMLILLHLFLLVSHTASAKAMAYFWRAWTDWLDLLQTKPTGSFCPKETGKQPDWTWVSVSTQCQHSEVTKSLLVLRHLIYNNKKIHALNTQHKI